MKLDEFQRRMIREGRCIWCGQKVLARGARECDACYRTQHHGARCAPSVPYGLPKRKEVRR